MRSRPPRQASPLRSPTGSRAFRLNWRRARSDVDIKVEHGSLRLRSARTASRYLGADAEPLRDADGSSTRETWSSSTASVLLRWPSRRVINVGGQKIHRRGRGGDQFAPARAPVAGAGAQEPHHRRPWSSGRGCLSAMPPQGDSRSRRARDQEHCRRRACPGTRCWTINFVPALAVSEAQLERRQCVTPCHRRQSRGSASHCPVVSAATTGCSRSPEAGPMR